MEINQKDLNVSETFVKISQHLEEVKTNNEIKLKVSLSDTQEVNLLLCKYSKELKTKFKYNKFLCNPDDLKKFLLDSFPNAKISFFKLLKLGFVNFGIIYFFLYLCFNIFSFVLVFNIFNISFQTSIIISVLFSFFISLLITFPLYPSEIKATKGQFKIE